jgi:hypothetical protein
LALGEDFQKEGIFTSSNTQEQKECTPAFYRGIGDKLEAYSGRKEQKNSCCMKQYSGKLEQTADDVKAV